MQTYRHIFNTIFSLYLFCILLVHNLFIQHVNTQKYTPLNEDKLVNLFQLYNLLCLLLEVIELNLFHHTWHYYISDIKQMFEKLNKEIDALKEELELLRKLYGDFY